MRKSPFPLHIIDMHVEHLCQSFIKFVVGGKPRLTDRLAHAVPDVDLVKHRGKLHRSVRFVLWILFVDWCDISGRKQQLDTRDFVHWSNGKNELFSWSINNHSTMHVRDNTAIMQASTFCMQNRGHCLFCKDCLTGNSSAWAQWTRSSAGRLNVYRPYSE